MSIELSELCNATGMKDNVMKIQNVSMANELKTLKDNKHNVFSIDKITVANDGAIIIVRFKNNKSVCYYFKSKSHAQKVINKWTHDVLNKKV